MDEHGPGCRYLHRRFCLAAWFSLSLAPFSYRRLNRHSHRRPQVFLDHREYVSRLARHFARSSTRLSFGPQAWSPLTPMIADSPAAN